MIITFCFLVTLDLKWDYIIKVSFFYISSDTSICFACNSKNKPAIAMKLFMNIKLCHHVNLAILVISHMEISRVMSPDLQILAYSVFYNS
jgi:hypothetical protein